MYLNRCSLSNIMTIIVACGVLWNIGRKLKEPLIEPTAEEMREMRKKFFWERSTEEQDYMEGEVLRKTIIHFLQPKLNQGGNVQKEATECY